MEGSSFWARLALAAGLALFALFFAPVLVVTPWLRIAVLVLAFALIAAGFRKLKQRNGP